MKVNIDGVSHEVPIEVAIHMKKLHEKTEKQEKTLLSYEVIFRFLHPIVSKVLPLFKGTFNPMSLIPLLNGGVPSPSEEQVAELAQAIPALVERGVIEQDFLTNLK
jgi:hypothetical protein